MTVGTTSTANSDVREIERNRRHFSAGMASGQAALTEFLRMASGNPCLVVLSTESELQGALCTIDGLFNLVLKEATEFVNGQRVNEFRSVYVRGNKVVHLAPT